MLKLVGLLIYHLLSFVVRGQSEEKRSKKKDLFRIFHICFSHLPLLVDGDAINECLCSTIAFETSVLSFSLFVICQSHYFNKSLDEAIFL